MKRWSALCATIGGAIGAGLSGAWIPTTPTLWAVREGIAWFAGGVMATLILGRTERR